MTTQLERTLERVMDFMKRLKAAALDMVDCVLVVLLRLASHEMVWFAATAFGLVLLVRPQ